MPSKTDKEIVLTPGANGTAPTEEGELLPALDDMRPREIVVELDKYIVGQNAAQRAVVETSIDLIREKKLDEVADRAEQAAEERVLDLLLPPSPAPATGASEADVTAQREQTDRTREKLRVQLREGKLDQRMVD